MRCRRCGTPLLHGFAFCGRCGCPVPNAAPAQPQVAFGRPPVQPLALKARIVVAVVAVVLAGIVVAAKGPGFVRGLQPQAKTETRKDSMLNAIQAALGGTTQAQGVAPSSLMEAQGSESASVLPANYQGSEQVFAAEGSSVPLMAVEGSTPEPTLGAQDSGMPAHIRQWLEHLERIESQRMALAGSQLGQAMSTLAGLQAGGGGGIDMAALAEGDENAIPDERSSKVGAVIGENLGHRQAWSVLVSSFHSVPPPAECTGIRNAYAAALQETGAMISEIVGALERSSEDREGALKTLFGMQGQSERRVGRPSRQANALVGEICVRYGAAKWFEIKADLGAGLMGRLSL